MFSSIPKSTILFNKLNFVLKHVELKFFFQSFLIVLACGNPMPQSSDDYGDFDGPIEPPKPDTQPLDGSAIGGLITDVIGGALNLFGAGVEILSDVIDGNVRNL